jgi:hypothetical protein
MVVVLVVWQVVVVNVIDFRTIIPLIDTPAAAVVDVALAAMSAVPLTTIHIL